MKAKNFYGYTSTDHRHSTITEKSREYCALRKAKEKEYYDKLNSKFRDVKTRNTKELWKILKDATGGAKGNLKMDINKVSPSILKILAAPPLPMNMPLMSQMVLGKGNPQNPSHLMPLLPRVKLRN